VKRSLLYLFLLVPCLSFAQSNFRPGYFVPNSGDTVKGFVNYKERSNNPSSLSFKANLADQSKVLSLKEVSAYGVNGQESFERYQVKISKNSVNLALLNRWVDSTFTVDTVLLKVLQAGEYVTTYSYTDDIKTRFYISEGQEKRPYELINNLSLDSTGSGRIIDKKVYAHQILAILRKLKKDSPQYEQRLEKLRYSESDILKTISLINGVERKKSVQPNTHFFAGLGLFSSKSYYSGDNLLAGENAINKRSYLPAFTTGLDLFVNPDIRKTIFRIEVSLSVSKGDVSTTTDYAAFARLSHTFDQYSIAITPQIIYNLYNSAAFKLFAGAGAGVNYSTYKNNITTRYNSVRDESSIEEPIQFEKVNLSFPLSIGVVLQKRIELSAIYVPPAAIATYTKSALNIQRYGLRVNYLFGK